MGRDRSFIEMLGVGIRDLWDHVTYCHLVTWSCCYVTLFFCSLFSSVPLSYLIMRSDGQKLPHSLKKTCYMLNKSNVKDDYLISGTN